MAIVRIPSPMRQYTEGERAVSVEGRTLAQALEHLVTRYPALQPRLFERDGEVHPFVNIFVDGGDVRLGDGLSTAMREDSEIAVIPAMAGGY